MSPRAAPMAYGIRFMRVVRCPRCGEYVAMGQNPNRTPGEHPIQSNYRKPKTGAEFTETPKWDPKTVLTHGHVKVGKQGSHWSSGSACF